MRKKYSDPLMFTSNVLLTIGPLHPSQNGDTPPVDEEEEDTDATNSLMMNSAPAQQATEPLTIVNPVEEAVTSSDVVTEESGAASTTETSPLEVAPIINDIVPDGTTSESAE